MKDWWWFFMAALLCLILAAVQIVNEIGKQMEAERNAYTVTVDPAIEYVVKGWLR